MASSSTATSSLTSEPDLTRIHAESDLQITHISKHTTSGILVGEGRTSGYYITPPSRKRPRSWIWRHGEAITRVRDGVKCWLCRFCYHDDQEAVVITTAEPTTMAQRHLIDKHYYNSKGIYTSKKVVPAKRKNVAVQIYDQKQAQQAPFDRTDFEGLYTSWALIDCLSLRQATSPMLRELLSYRNPLLADAAPSSHPTISRWIKEYYRQAKIKVIDHLSKARSRITLSFDGWTSKSNMDLLAVIAHYIDVNHTPQAVLLSLQPTHGSHTGENIAHCLYRTIYDFKIATSISYLIADNAAANDTAIDLLSDEIDVNTSKQRLRCAAHIINLVCKAILLGVDSNCVEDACQDRLNHDQIDDTIQHFESTIQDETRALIAWRRKGPVGKLHNLVHHIRASPRHRELFESKQKEVDIDQPVYKVVTNGGVRWNSTYDMIHRSLKLKDAFVLYASDFRFDKQRPTAEDELSPDDWYELKQLLHLLKPMKEASTDIQAKGVEGALWHNLTALDYLMTHLERERQLYEHQDTSHFKACINLGWKKLDKYYRLSDTTIAYRAAIYFNPRLKFAWFEAKWGDIHPTWLVDVTRLIDQLYKTYQRRYPNEQPLQSTAYHSKERSDYQAYNSLTNTTTNCSELQRYNKEPLVEDDVDILKWWCDNKARYPILYRIAMDHLAVPATTAEDEREFSKGDDVINNDRARLGEDTAEAIQCLRSWIGNELIDLRKVSIVYTI